MILTVCVVCVPHFKKMDSRLWEAHLYLLNLIIFFQSRQEKQLSKAKKIDEEKRRREKESQSKMWSISGSQEIFSAHLHYHKSFIDVC